MPKATMRRNKRMMMTLGCQFNVGRTEFAQIVSHGLLFRPESSRTTREAVIYSGDFAVGRGISRTGLLRWVRRFVLEFGTWKICWGEEADMEHAVRRRAYELVDLYFPELKT